MFRAETGMSPFAYIRQQRLTEAARALRSGRHRVVDVALDFVFDSHAGFTRAFANGFGIPPKQFASRPPPDGWLIPYRYLNRAHSHAQEFTMTTTAVIFTQIVERPARKLILRRAPSASDYMEYVEEIGCGNANASSAWDILTGITDALYEPVGLWLPDTMRTPGTGTYAHGVEVAADYAGTIPNGFDVIDLPSCLLIVFQGEPYNDDHYGEAVGVCMERIASFNPEVYGYEYAPERAPRMQLAPEGWRGYIEMLPIRAIGAGD